MHALFLEYCGIDIIHLFYRYFFTIIQVFQGWTSNGIYIKLPNFSSWLLTESLSLTATLFAIVHIYQVNVH